MSSIEQTAPRTSSFPIVSLWSLSIVVLLVALGVSGYLSYLKIDTDQTAACIAGGTFDCNTVLNSVYSEIMDIPIAYLGFGLNVVMLGLLLLERRVNFFTEHAPTIFFGIVTFAFVFSVYLVYLQARVIRAYCPWCLAHEALIAGLFVMGIFRLRNSLQGEEIGD